MDLKRNSWLIVALLANLFVICLAYLLFMNLSYPLVGADYSLAVPFLLDTSLFFRRNGFTIQWYTPSFGAGLPAFPNPNNAQFSLYALLGVFMQPWQAVMLSVVILVALGFFTCFYLFWRVFNLDWKASLLGAIFFSSNGFMMVRLGIGHLGYAFFPILPLLFVALLDGSIPFLISSLLIAVIIGLAIHGAGYAILIMFAMAAILVLPLVFIYNPGLISWRRLIGTVVLGGVVGLLISASKLSAVFSFMRFYPRLITDNVQTNPWLATLGVLVQLLGTMNLLPLFLLTRTPPIILQNLMSSFGGAGVFGPNFGYWEFDMSISPIVFWILLVALVSAVLSPRKYLTKLMSDFKWLALICLCFSCLLCLELIISNGSLFEVLRQLPILSSMHVNQRFSAALIFPICLLSTLCLNKWLSHFSGRKAVWILLTLDLLAILPLGIYFLFSPDPLDRNYDITSSGSIFSKLRTGDPLEIKNIGYTSGNTQTLLIGTSNLNPYEPIFGYFLENFHPETKPGSVWEVSDGYYNMTDPTGYVFPEINGSRPFERIHLNDKEKLNSFVRHLVPDWKIPLTQQILDWASLISSIITGLILSIYFIQRILKRSKAWSLLEKFE